MNKKYERVIGSGHKLYRIRALRSFSDVKEGDLGGWIEKESNLSHDGDCWVRDNAKVFGNASVRDDAQVSDNANVYDTARVSDSAVVCGDVWIYGNAQISDTAWVYGDAKVCGDARVSGKARVCFDAMVCGGEVLDKNDVRDTRIKTPVESICINGKLVMCDNEDDNKQQPEQLTLLYNNTKIILSNKTEIDLLLDMALKMIRK
jgi:carbonic anhydrase/acetyltransferase-like protein (isoleucine patch superfamily)